MKKMFTSILAIFLSLSVITYKGLSAEEEKVGADFDIYDKVEIDPTNCNFYYIKGGWHTEYDQTVKTMKLVDKDPDDDFEFVGDVQYATKKIISDEWTVVDAIQPGTSYSAVFTFNYKYKGVVQEYPYELSVWFDIDDVLDEHIYQIDEDEEFDLSVDNYGTKTYSRYYDGTNKIPTITDPDSEDNFIITTDEIVYSIKKLNVNNAQYENVSEAVEPGKYLITTDFDYTVYGETRSKKYISYYLEIKKDYRVAYIDAGNKVYDGTPAEIKIYLDAKEDKDKAISKDSKDTREYLVEGEDYEIVGIHTHLLKNKLDEAVDAGVYDVDIKWLNDFNKRFVDESFKEDTMTFTFEIERLRLDVVGWDILAGGESINAKLPNVIDINVTFNWKLNEETGNITMQYNGYSPLMFMDEDEDLLSVPNLKFKVHSTGEEIELERGILGDYMLGSNIFDEVVLTNTRNSGEHEVAVVFLKNYYTTDLPKYEITPKEIEISYKDTSVAYCGYYGGPSVYFPDVNNSDLESVDKYLGLNVAYSYYAITDTKLEHPFYIAPRSEGVYIARAEYVTYADGVLKNPNYIIKNKLVTSFVVVTKKSANMTYVSLGSVSVGTMNNSSIEGLKIDTPFISEVEDLLELDNDVCKRLKEAVDAGKHFNLFVVANDVSDERRSELNLSDENCKLVDLSLYAIIDDEFEILQITETGDYDVSLRLSLDAETAETLGIKDGRSTYVDRYHNGNKNADKTQYVLPVVDEETGKVSFTMTTNAFSDYAIYTSESPKAIDLSDIIGDHIVPNTAA